MKLPLDECNTDQVSTTTSTTSIKAVTEKTYISICPTSGNFNVDISIDIELDIEIILDDQEH